MKHPLEWDFVLLAMAQVPELAPHLDELEALFTKLATEVVDWLPETDYLRQASDRWHRNHMHGLDILVPIGGTTQYDYPQASALLIKSTKDQFNNWFIEIRQEERMSLIQELTYRQLLHFLQYVKRSGCRIDESFWKFVRSDSKSSVRFDTPEFLFTYEGLQSTVMEVYLINSLLFKKTD